MATFTPEFFKRLMRQAAPDSFPEEPDAGRPMPTVKQSAQATVSGDDNDERGLLGDLSGGINVDERAALNDPRASASNTDMRQSFDRMSNIFLTSAGLPSQGLRSNPYKTERDDMRDWLMRRASVARGAESNALNAERTKAYLDATQSQRELALRAQELRAEREGRAEDAAKAKAEREALESERRAEETKRKAGLEERSMTLKEKEFARKSAPKPKGPELSPKGFPAGWELEGKTQPTPKQGEQFEGLVYSSEKMRGLTNQMRDMLREAGSGRVLPGAAKSRMSQLAKEIQIEGKNIAELGALSGPDYSLMEAIAADPTKVDSFMKDMPALLNGLDKWGDNSVQAKAKSLGARRSGAAAAPAAPSGTVTIRRKSDGVTKTLPADKAAEVLKDSKYERVQ